MAKFGRAPQDDDDDAPKKKGARLPVLAMPQITEPRCKCCMSPYRSVIDRLLATGVPVSVIATNFEPENLSRANITNHRNKHLSIETRAIREIVEEEARRQIEDIDDVKTTLITGRSWMRTALMTSYTELLEGRLKFEGRDAIQMIALMEKMDEKSAGEEKEEMLREINLFSQAVKEVVPPAMFEDILRKFEDKLTVEDRIIADFGRKIPDITQELPSATYDLEAEEEDDTDGRE